MDKGIVQVFFGNGSGKTTAAIGTGIRGMAKGKSVILIQFLKGRDVNDEMVFKRLEPDMKAFRFEKHIRFFAELSDEEKQEEMINIQNGLNFAKKVLVTGECGMLILDEVLGLIDYGIITHEDIIRLIEKKNDEVDLILTGRCFPQALLEYVDNISEIRAVTADE